MLKKTLKYSLYSLSLIFTALVITFSAINATAEILNCTCPVYDPYVSDLSAEYGDPSTCGIIGPVEYAYIPPDPDCGILGPIRYAYFPNGYSGGPPGWYTQFSPDYLALGYPVVSIVPGQPGDTWGGNLSYYYTFRNPSAVCPEGRWELRCCIQPTDYLAQGYPLVAKKLHFLSNGSVDTYYGFPVYWFYFQGLNYTYTCCEDNDSDGHYAISSTCQQSDDCNDNDAAIHPDAAEICNGIDHNCNGLADETCNGGSDNKCTEISNSTKIGSSANFASGNLYHSQQVLGAHTGHTASITLSYNSLDTTTGTLGKGWTYNYNTTITDNGNILVLKEGDGRRVYFHSSGTNTYSPDFSSGSHSTITKNPDGSYILTEKTGIKYDYNSNGSLIRITDRNNNTLTFTYTGSDLTSITESSGRTTTLTYDSNHRIASIMDPAGRTTTFTYNSDFLISVTDPLGSAWSYTYDANGRMLTKTDPLWHTTSYSYDAYGKITSSQDPNGNIKTILYNQTGKTAYVTEKNGTQWTYAYDNSLNVPLQVTDPSGNQTAYQYDSNRNLISKTEPDGRTTSYTYDTSGNVLSQTDALGNITAYTYNSFGQTLTKTDPDGNITTYIYDINGDLIQEIDALGDITSHTYGSHGERLSTIDPNGNLNVYTYDQYGNLASVTNALNQTTTYSYDIMGNLISAVDANGAATTYEYNLRDRLVREIKPDNGIINYEYDSADNRTAITDANGNRTAFTYDNLNRLIKTTDPEGNSINYSYDSEGNTTSMIIKDSSNNIITSESYTYDVYNRLIKTTYADGTFIEQGYDIHGNILTKKDENGNITTFAYDALDRLLSATDPNGQVTSHTYDKRNNLKTVADANGNITTYTYDSLNRLVSTVSPDTGTATYSYDPNGNLITKTDANSVAAAYTYDALNRQTAVQFPDPAQNITYYYDNTQLQNNIGRLSSMTDPSGTTWYDYDKIGRVIGETKQINNITYRTEYKYDLNGNILTMTYPGSRVIAYMYNQQNRATSVTETFSGAVKTLANNITYLPFGDVTSMTMGNGIATAKTYDNRNRLNSLNIGTLKQLSNSRDNAGNITAITDNLDASKNKTFTYDSLYRLTQATGAWGSLNYSYDGSGNRQTETTNTGSTIYNYTANKLTVSAGEKAFNFSYDNNGNTVSENTRQYIYNQNQRLIKAMDGSNVLSEYVYNGNGQRVKKTSGTQCTIFHYDQSGLLIAESTSTGAITSEYVYLNGQPLAKIQDNNSYYYHNDHLGTPMMMTSSSGSVVWNGEFKPFGEQVSITGSVTNNLRLPGQYYNSETGMHYNYFRDYKPEIGRYVESDPIGIQKGNNHLFVYVGNNPVNRIDLLGLEAIYGNWCGPNWTGACKEKYTLHPPGYYKTPIDNNGLDNACMNHDICYYKCRKKYPCDKINRSNCFLLCDFTLANRANEIGGFWGNVVGTAIGRPGDRDAEPNDCSCTNKGK